MGQILHIWRSQHFGSGCTQDNKNQEMSSHVDALTLIWEIVYNLSKKAEQPRAF